MLHGSVTGLLSMRLLTTTTCLIPSLRARHAPSVNNACSQQSRLLCRLLVFSGRAFFFLCQRRQLCPEVLVQLLNLLLTTR